MKTLRAICLHVERLHEDRVWRRLQAALDELDRKGLKITFLVYPLRSVVAGSDVRARVRELAERGHEIGQHTHFYAGGETERPHKRTDLSDRNVRECIARDRLWLGECGVEPKGFCGGNFMMTEAAFEALADAGFTYDCSARLPWERKDFETPHPWAEGAEVRRFGGRALVLLPNTEYLTLPQMLHPRRRKRRAKLANGGGFYQLVMNHDYDLLRWKVWYGLLAQLRSAAETRTAGQLAEMCLTHEDESLCAGDESARALAGSATGVVGR
ncbi:MAG TPA: polysaccharide deacetylase family protein [Pyrinomonadaceae bacterium]|nr:polysaccharide deacetylase family protein [Pyrinomonadaceae bacterium]